MTELTRERMIEYLRNSERLDCTVRIRYPTIVQKSYGTEKRFFVPAPIISLEGRGWVNKMKQLQFFYNQQAQKRNIDSSLMPSPTVQGSIAIHDVADHPILNFEFDEKVKSFLAKTMYIRHGENRNYLQIVVELKYNMGCRLGAFVVGRAKVISKASKAKNTAGSIDFKYLAVSSGQEICLSNRPKAPPVTRFITGEKDKFSCSATNWTPLTIHLLQTTEPGDDELDFKSKDGPIRYNDIVRLVDKSTGMSLPRLRLCKVNKDKVVFPKENAKRSDQEILNQMQKVVLQMVDDADFTYVLLDEAGITLKTIEREEKAKDAKVHEAGLFTICCTAEQDYKFYEAMGQTMYDVFPSPTNLAISVDTVDIALADIRDGMIVSLSGKNLTDDLSVWFGGFKCKTEFRGLEMLEFSVPLLSSVFDQEIFRSFFVSPTRIDVPVTLVRDDGVIFSTGLKFSYMNAKQEDYSLDF